MTTTFTNSIHVYAASMGKMFRVTHICENDDDANEECRKNPDVGVIMSDNAGRIYLAELYGSVCPSAIIEDIQNRK